MRSALLYSLLFAVAASLANGDDAFAPYPVRNGDFSVPGHGWQPASWHFHTFSGQYTLSMNAEPGPGAPPQAVIAATTPGRACIYQDVPLPRGRYRFTVHACPSLGAQAVVDIAGTSASTAAAGDWQSLTVEFDAEGPARVHLIAVGGGSVAFRLARIEPIELVCAAVPAASGPAVGAIALDAPASPAARFAARELQRCIAQMTG
ncbi:MAG: hypothetical protein JXR94_02470, partial [Candidatus Hydrogenedentes bacterium]|nr:hypothetical protein [Candidatus Hydrogenedentota bacterium]